mgnify:CR=1 FL=1
MVVDVVVGVVVVVDVVDVVGVIGVIGVVGVTVAVCTRIPCYKMFISEVGVRGYVRVQCD